MKKTLQKIGCFFFLGLILTSFGCRKEQREVSEPVSAPSDSRLSVPGALGKTLADFNRGAAILEQYDYFEAAKAFESVLAAAPDWTAARFNLGLAYFNMQEKPAAQSYLDLAQKDQQTNNITFHTYTSKDRKSI